MNQLEVKYGEDILGDERVAHWLSGMQNRASARQYSVNVRHFFTWLKEKHPEYKTPSDFIIASDADQIKPLTERRNVARQIIVEFYDYQCTEAGRKDARGKVVGKGLSFNAAKNNVAAVRSLLSEYGITIKLERRHKLMRKSKDPFKRMRLTLEQVRALLSHARLPRDRAIIILLAQGGMDQDTLCSMTLKDVKGALVEGAEFPYQLDLLRGKAGVEYFTFLTQEGADALKVYLADLKQRGIELKEDDPLWISDKGRIPTQPHNIQSMLRIVAEKTGLANGEDRYNVAGGHALREFLSSTLEDHGMPRSTVDALLGHTLDAMTKAYFKKNPETVREQYRKALEYITLTSTPTNNGVLLGKLKVEFGDSVERLTAKNADLENRLTALISDNQAMKSKIAELEEGDRKFREGFNEWQAKIENVIEQLANKK